TAATILAKPALAQGLPEVRWRMPSSFPKSLSTLYGGAEFFTQQVAAMSDGKFTITPFAGGEIVPPLQVLDAVQNGTVEAGQTAPYYYVGKDPTFAFGSTVPFGFNARQQLAWILQGGGLQLMNELTKDYNVLGFPGGKRRDGELAFRHHRHALGEVLRAAIQRAQALRETGRHPPPDFRQGLRQRGFGQQCGRGTQHGATRGCRGDEPTSFHGHISSAVRGDDRVTIRYRLP
ncbi:MAG: hypothetical protein J0H99_28240, partial [Rhodospirillales bacterium]|nr:hypothetical protein [Rhodospirillales bacterium]